MSERPEKRTHEENGDDEVVAAKQSKAENGKEEVEALKGESVELQKNGVYSELHNFPAKNLWHSFRADLNRCQKTEICHNVRGRMTSTFVFWLAAPGLFWY